MYIIVWYAPDRWCRLHHRQITDTEKRKYSLHIPLVESRKVGSERRAVGAVLPAGRATFRNPKNLIHCLLGFWGPDWAFGCGISAQKRIFHTRLSCVKVPLSCKISRFCPDFPILTRQNRDFPTLDKSSGWHGKKSRFSFHFLQVWNILLIFAPCCYFKILHCMMPVQNVDGRCRQLQAAVVIVRGLTARILPVISLKIIFNFLSIKRIN